jgi:hypothetical protein
MFARHLDNDLLLLIRLPLLAVNIDLIIQISELSRLFSKG